MKLRRFSALLITTAMFLAGCGDTPAPEHQHQWKDPTYTWTVDYSSCTAERACQTCELKETETVSSTYTVVTPATETDDGLGRYTATFTNTAFTVQTHDVTIPASGGGTEVIDTFEKAVNSIKTKHNYSAHLVNQWANESTPWVEFNYYNINDGAMFDDYSVASSGMYSGYIKQKDQGIITFRMPTNGSGIIAGSFVATNTNLGISDFYSLAVEHIVDKEFTYDSTKEAYVCSDFDALAVIGNLGFGNWVELTIAPENFTAKFVNGNLIINAVFEVHYFDEVQVDTTADITLTVSSIEKTSNERIESYVANPDYTFVAPTEWTAGAKENFDEEFNGYYPPFINGLSYSWDYGVYVSEGYYVAIVEDYYAGDLTGGYAALLPGAGFHEVSNPGYTEYQKVVEDEVNVHTYSIKMKYHAPTDKDKSGMEYGYLYPNGVSTFIFLHKQKTKETIVNVGLLNEYISKSIAGTFLPSFTFDDETRVSGFKDATESGSSYVLLLKGESNQFFDIYPNDTQARASSKVEAYVAALRELGFECQSSDSFQQYWCTDEYFSQIKITDPAKVSNWSTSSKLQVRIEITQETLDHYQEEIVYMDSLTVTNQTKEFTLGSEFVFDGTVTLTYSNGDTEIVVPTEVIGPDMNQAGQQSVVVRYTNEEGQTIGTSYTVEIKAPEVKYSITVQQVEGATISVTYPTSLESEAGKAVNFKVTVQSGYTLKSVSVKCNGEAVSVSGPNPFTGAYQFTMPSGDVIITAVVEGQSKPTHNIFYKVYNTSFDELAYADVIADTSVLPTSAKEGSSVNYSVATKSGYQFAYVTITEDEEAFFDTASFSYTMGTTNLEFNIVVAEKQPEPAKHSISYTIFNASADYEVISYSTVIADTSVLPTIADENSTVNFSVVTKEGYSFLFASIGEDGDPITTSSFTGQMGTSNLEIFIVVQESAPVAPTLSSIALSRYSTQYEVGDTFSFDGVVTASYSNGDTKVVTPTSVSSPDMSTAGRKEVTVSYTEDGTTVTASYYIVVEEGQGGGGEEQSIYGSYTHDRENAFSNPDYYDRYTITLNEDGTGTYVRENHNSAPTTKTMNFKYVISGSSITFTFVSGENTDAYNGYRLFPYGPSEGYVPTNATGVINADGTISVTLYKSGADNGRYTFTKAA